MAFSFSLSFSTDELKFLTLNAKEINPIILGLCSI